MRRRQFVTTALLAGSLTGCVGFQSNDSPTEANDNADTPNGDPTETITDESRGVQRHIELKNVELSAENVPVSIGINIQESKVTADQPARIEVGFIITEDIHLQNGSEIPVGKTLSDDDTPGLVLLPLQEASEITRVDDRMWKPDRPKGEQWTAPATDYKKDISVHTLLTNELEVWADHQNDGYFEPGSYRFPNNFWVNGEQVDWSFTITVHKAD